MTAAPQGAFILDLRANDPRQKERRPEGWSPPAVYHNVQPWKDTHIMAIEIIHCLAGRSKALELDGSTQPRNSKKVG